MTMAAAKQDRAPLSEYEEVATKRDRYLSPSLKTFTAFTRPLQIVRGKDQFLWDETGKKYLDCLSQNLTISVGYGNKVVHAAVAEQYAQIEHVTTMFYNPVPGLLAEDLVGTLPKETDWVVHFVNSGAEAIDLAILLARVYTKNFEVVCLRDSYHGLHFTTMGATGMSSCRQPVPTAPGFVHVPAPNQYKGIFGPGVDPYVQEVANTIWASTPGKVAAFLVEPIQGYTGVIPMPDGYIRKAVDIIRSAGGLYIADEVQTGFARTGDNFWGFEAHDVIPDIVVMGKGIANGLPVSAVAVRRDVAQSMCDHKFFNTFGSNPVGCAAGRAVLKVIRDDKLQQNAKKVGNLIREGLTELAKKHPTIGDVRGSGLINGMEIVKNRDTREPATDVATKLHDTAKLNGVVMGRAGRYHNVIRICPPLCIHESDVDLFLETVDRGLSS